MYTYIKAYVKLDNHWREKDVSAETLLFVTNSYQNTRLVCTIVGETAERCIDFRGNRYALSMADNTQTITAWLSALDPATVSHDNTAVSFNQIQCVKHFDLFDLPVTVSKGNINYGVDVPIPVGMDKDLQIVSKANDKTELSTANLAKNCLFALNGRICITSFDTGRAFIVDARDKVAATGGNVLSVIDFTDVGGLTQVNITADMVDAYVRNDKDISMKRQRVLINLPKAYLGTTPILVLDGHLHILDGSYRRKDGNKLFIDINLEHLMKRASQYKQTNHTYVNSANVREKGVDGKTFDVKKFLDQTDSFIAFVHTEELCLFKEPLQQTGLYGGYEHYRAPKGIVVSERMEYMPHRYEEVSAEHLSITVGDNVRRPFFFDGTGFDFQSKFADNTFTTARREYKKAYALEMYTF